MSTPGPQDAPLSWSPTEASPAPPYAPPGPPAPAGSGSDSQAVLAFVLGIFSVVMIPLLGPVAIVVANRTLRGVDAGVVPVESRGLATAGKVLGIIGTVLLALVVLVLVAGIVFLVAVGHLASSGH